MIDSAALLQDLRRLLTRLERDIRERLEENPALDAELKSEWRQARDGGRTSSRYFDWRNEAITQSGAHWILGCVFLRFLEDNRYLDRPFLFGPDSTMQALARDRHESYFRANPGHSDREFLLACFNEAAKLPGLSGLFDSRHNPLFRLGVSGDGAIALLDFWRKIDPDTGQLIYSFGRVQDDTGFLGDLYQDLSRVARKQYALLQTPSFVAEFILDRTLTPAINEFGYREVRLIDPACGSGHFLLGAFRRLFDLWARNEPARNLGDLAQRALDSVFGVDVNPFACAIARFRLLMAALDASNNNKLAAAPAFKINIACGDSLLHGPRLRELALSGEAENLARRGLAHVYAFEDREALERILGQQYQAVVGNPPYITPKDAALNAAYRSRYASCHMKYSLAVPFTERFFELAIPGGESGEGAGYVGMITANSFMKREFGKKLIEQFLQAVDLTHVIDTSGAYIPGHGTPTVILFGRNRKPVASTVRTVMGIKGEPATPDDPAQGFVWRAILDQVDRAGSESGFASVANTPRETFARHPWSIGGGGAAELKELIDAAAHSTLTDKVIASGFGCVISEEEAFFNNQILRLAGKTDLLRPLVIGDEVRDWRAVPENYVLFPYDEFISLLPIDHVDNALWWARTLLSARRDFGNRTYSESWAAVVGVPSDSGTKEPNFALDHLRLRRPHNHFVLDRGGKVFKQSAPVIKLPVGAGEDGHLALLGLLNSSVACFWGRQTLFPKGGFAAGKWEERLEWDSTKLQQFPLADSAPTELARTLDRLAQELTACSPANVIRASTPIRERLNYARSQADTIRARMIALQEELDWHCYQLYGLIENVPLHPNPPPIRLGERAFEIVLTRKLADGEEETTWFERHGSTPITQLPSHWSADYRSIVERRIGLIESDKYIGLIERPEYKRRWASQSWEEQEQTVLRDWLLDRLEDARYWPRDGTPKLKSVNTLADMVRLDSEFMQVAELYTGRADFNVPRLVAELVESEAVPFLPVLRYSESGLQKRAEWEKTWVLQRREDEIDRAVEAEYAKAQSTSPPEGNGNNSAIREAIAAEQKRRKALEIGEIPVPPKYKSSDFFCTTFWRLRGGLDVPKERFVSYPFCSRAADGSLVVAWASWDHLQQATALAAHYLQLKEEEGWPAERLKPLLGGLLELIPWLKQWHDEYDPEHGTGMGDYFAGFVGEEARSLGFTLDELRAWRPPPALARNRRRAGAA